jgi:phosphoglucosamine mutase
MQDQSNVPKLFGTSGIRGNVQNKVTERFMLDLARAMSTMLANEGLVIVGSDYRTTSAELRATVLGGLLGGGIDVVDAGILPTPVLAFGVRAMGANAGMMVTASHNPPEDNGVKCYSHEGREYIPEEEQILEQFIARHQFTDVGWDGVGTQIIAPDFIDTYAQLILERVGSLRRKLKVVVDCANGTTYNLTPLILSKLGCEVISLNAHPDGRFPGRPAEPSPEHLVTACNFVRSLKADLGIAHDGDGDRLAVIDEKGRFVNNDTVLAFFARLLLMENGPGRIITSVDTSSRIYVVARSAGGKVERTRLGKTHALLDEENRKSVRLCCEPWKIIDPAWGFWGDAIYAACRLVQSLDQTKGSVSSLFRGIPENPQKRFFFRCPDESKDVVMAKVSQELTTQKDVSEVWTFDGVRVNFRDESWILVRKSGTEGKIRIYCEGRTPKRLKQLVAESSGLVRSAIRNAHKSHARPIRN